jgi:antiphage defense system Thoeris ThsB-like protein
MAKRQIFYSFHYDNDVFRVQQIRNMGALDGNEPVAPNVWEQVKRGGDSSIKRWIEDNMKYKNCIIVLIGSATATRPWVKYEIEKAWDDGKPIFGIYIHNLKDPKTGVSTQGSNPFYQVVRNGRPLDQQVTCYNPNMLDAYGDISKNIAQWVETAISVKK